MNVASSADQPEFVPPASDTEPETEDTRTARQRILDHLEDTEGPQHVTAICTGTALDRAVVDPVLSRLTSKGVLIRVAAATYALAPPQPEPAPVPIPAEVPRADGIPASEWLHWLHEHRVTGKWQGIGKPPGPEGLLTPGFACPIDVFMKFTGECDAIAKQRAEDAALRDRLIPAAAGNLMRGPKLDDVRALRVMLAAGIPIEEIEQVVKYQHDRRLKPSNPPLASWADLFQPVAVHHHRFVLAKRTAAKWRERPSDADSTTDASPVLRRAMSEIASGMAAGAPDCRLGHLDPSAARGARKASPGRGGPHDTNGDNPIPLADDQVTGVEERSRPKMPSPPSRAAVRRNGL